MALNGQGKQPVYEDERSAVAIGPPSPLPPAQRPRFGELLIERGLLTRQQLDDAIALQAKSPDKLIGEILKDEGYIDEAQLVSALAHSKGVPFVKLRPNMVQAEALSVLPWAFMREHNVLPISNINGWFTVAVEDFSNILLIESLERRTGLQVQVLASTADNIREVRSTFAGEEEAVEPDADESPEESERELGEMINEMGLDDLTIVAEEDQGDDLRDLENAASDSPVIRMVNYVIKAAIDQKASDIHIEPEDGECRVRLRIDGDLSEVLKPPAKLHNAVVSRIKIMAALDISERRIPQDGAISVQLDNRNVDLRVSTMPGKFGEKVVIRVIDNNAAKFGLDNLGFADRLLEQFRGALHQANGIVLVTGPTGSGKSTTLYAALKEIATVKRNISTVEDPVEFNLKGINQFQVNTKAGFTFAKALRALLRQDPDVLMVGEIRDVETAKLATEAALTGHLVLSTLHTNDAPTAIPRLINMGVESYLVAASLRAVLAQRLVRRICANCRADNVELTPVQRELAEQLDNPELHLTHASKGKGCTRCRQTGYAGRCGVHELVVVNEELLGSMIGDMSISAIRKVARQHGAITLLEDGMEKVKQGIIDVDSLMEIVAHV